MDGLELYGSEYLFIRFRSSLLEKVGKLEIKAQTLARSRLSRVEFADTYALLVGRFLLGIQNALAASSTEKNDYVPWSNRLSNQDFAGLIWDFYQAPDELDKILVLAQCLENGSTPSLCYSSGALRSMTTLARMLDPADWGATCWRNLACLGYRSMTELKQSRLQQTSTEVQDEFAALTAQDILSVMTRMRAMVCRGLPTTASVAAALFCISMDIWPLDADFERPDPLTNLAHPPRENQAATV